MCRALRYMTCGVRSTSLLQEPAGLFTDADTVDTVACASVRYHVASAAY